MKPTQAIETMRTKHSLKLGPLTLRDFNRVCEGEGIEVLRADIRLAGLIVWISGGPVIMLDSKLRGHKRRTVAFHELGHYFMHRDRKTEKQSGGRRSPKEIEADRFAELATVG